MSQGILQLQEDLFAYDPQDIYNMDETGLFYRLLPNSTLATGPVSGKKNQKERITVAQCANATSWFHWSSGRVHVDVSARHLTPVYTSSTPATRKLG